MEEFKKQLDKAWKMYKERFMEFFPFSFVFIAFATLVSVLFAVTMPLATPDLYFYLFTLFLLLAPLSVSFTAVMLNVAENKRIYPQTIYIGYKHPLVAYRFKLRFYTKPFLLSALIYLATYVFSLTIYFLFLNPEFYAQINELIEVDYAKAQELMFDYLNGEGKTVLGVITVISFYAGMFFYLACKPLRYVAATLCLTTSSHPRAVLFYVYCRLGKLKEEFKKVHRPFLWYYLLCAVLSVATFVLLMNINLVLAYALCAIVFIILHGLIAPLKYIFFSLSFVRVIDKDFQRAVAEDQKRNDN